MTSLCNTCGICFRENWELRDHNKKVHDTRILKCNICGEETIGQGKLDSHRNKHRTRQCNICWITLPANSLTRHKAKCQGDNLFCDICIYQTPRNDLMKKHYKSMHEAKAPKIEIEKHLHSCPHCKKSFKMKKHLARDIILTMHLYCQPSVNK